MFLTAIILINIIWDICRPNSLKSSQEKNEGRILHGKKVSGRATLLSNLQDFLLHFKKKEVLFTFLTNILQDSLESLFLLF